jgi:hypothetical protein
MKKYTTIFWPGVAFGGYSYQVTSNGAKCHIQMKTPRSRNYRTVLTISRAEWEALVETYGLNDPTRRSALSLAKLLEVAK